ncbi:zinc-binding dehydrogenase [Nocardia aurantiaca]|uniref:Zinc-binding dehydrogenase n=1 Tax=Nocardia aurantiaca TaxID=2675850 RepID=A0A6I3L4Z8_9NOCA|nr:zinc-binding dehydrogenase [Nocardia aurantiaca]MTE16388.1 zinc-binding dehydrogenase [Nocardia aurantiaca]
MRAVINNPNGDSPVSFGDVGEPVPAPNEALIAVRAFSVNRGELALLGIRPEGWRPGQDVAGVVIESAADGSGPQPGSRVVGMVEQAGWSERAAVSTSRLTVLSDELTMEQAAALPMAGLTALRTLRIGGNVLGRRVLITGANGGVGRFQVQLAALSGAIVTAVTTQADQVAEELTGLGAAEVVADVDSATGPFDLVLESVGGAALTGALAKLVPGGTVVVLGSSSGEKAPIDVYNFIGHEGARLQNYISYAATDPDDVDLAILVSLVAAGRLVATPGHVSGWGDLGKVVERMRQRELPGGKVVLAVD